MTTPSQYSLIDVQNFVDHRQIAIDKVGVKDVEIPLTIIQKDGKEQMVHAMVTMSVGLSKEFKGTHLSRFIIQLTEWSRNKTFSLDVQEFLQESMMRLNTHSAFLRMDFRYFIDKRSPVTHMAAPMAYPCYFDAELVNGHYKFYLGVEVPIATLCPCSKAISDYGAHNQRAMIRARMLLDTGTEHRLVWIEDVVAALDECASCPVYPILKREDEKYVTERAYDNPKFVEDVIREATDVLNKTEGVKGFELTVEAFESIHGHNAWAYQQVNL